MKLIFFVRDAYQGALSDEEMFALEQAAREKSAALSLIEAREREIRAIRDGQLTSKKVKMVIHLHVAHSWGDVNVHTVCP